MQETTPERCCMNQDCWGIRPIGQGKRMSVALLMVVLENGVSCMFQHAVVEMVKRLTETISI
jgi:hypothetical protein